MEVIAKEPLWAPPPLISIPATPSSSLHRRFSRFRSSSAGKNCLLDLQKEEPAAEEDQQLVRVIGCLANERKAETETESIAEPSVESLEAEQEKEELTTAFAINQVEDGELPCEDVEEQPSIKQQELGSEVNKVLENQTKPDDDMEEGELPPEDMEDPDHDEKTASPSGSIEFIKQGQAAEMPKLFFPFTNDPVLNNSMEPEYSLVDWHAHISTGKPLETLKAPIPDRNAQNEKKKKRRRKGSTAPNAKKKKSNNVESGDKQMAYMVGKMASTSNTVENGVRQMACIVANKAPTSDNVPVSESRQEAISPGACQQVNQQKEVLDSHQQKQETAPEQECSLTMLVEKELGIWVDPEQKVKEKKAQKRVLTAQRKEKKRVNARIKRAEKERQMGIVRRRPVIYKQLERPPVICKYFLKGRCTKGENCTFSHDATPETKSQLCKYFLTHCCLKGDDCPFSHDPSNFPCKYMVTRGFCNDGDNCRFSHAPVSEEEREKIKKRVLSERKEQEAAETRRNQTGDGDHQDEDTQGDDQTAFSGPEETLQADYDPAYGEEDIHYDPMPWNNQGTEQHGEVDYSPDYDPAPQELWRNVGSEEQDDNHLRKAAREAAAAQAAKMPSVAGPGLNNSFSSSGSIMDLLQQSLKESGEVFY